MELNKENRLPAIPEVLGSGEYEFEKYSKLLEKTSYVIGKELLFKAGKTTFIPISNFLAIVDEQINYNNGRDISTFYKVHGVIISNYQKLEQIKITKQELENFSFTLNKEWKLEAIICAKQGNKDIMREVAQLLSKDDIITRDIYAHTGFEKIDGKLIYLYHNGYVGDLGDTNIEVDLSDDKLEQYQFSDKEDIDIKEALATSFSILELADYKITIPLLATTYLAPLTTIFQEEGINADYILWLEGKSGTRKSSLTAVMLSHFGNFSRNSFPCSFRDTLNSIEKKAFILKDSLNVIDDFNPETNGNRKSDIAEKLFGMYGDRAGRDRMSQDGKTLKSPYIARGLCIVTGESFPNVAQSRLARAILVDVKKNSINLSILTELQENKEKLSFCMKKYIEWIIENETEIRRYSKNYMKELQEGERNNGIHGRTNEAVNVITIGFNLFLAFLKENNLIKEEEEKELSQLAYTTLVEVAQEQGEEIDENNPVKMFTNAIEQLYLSGKIYLKDYNEYDLTEYSNSTFVGMVDNKTDEGLYYFFPDIIYKEIVKFYKGQDIKFPISKSALWKYLDLEGYLYKTPKSQRRTVERKIPLSDNYITVIPVLQEKMRNIYLEPRKYKPD